MRTVLVLAFAALAPSLAGAQEASPAKLGGQLLERHCARCHAVGSSGASPRADAPPFRTLAARYPLDSLEEALAESNIAGHPDMPELNLETSEVAAMIAYLKSIQPR